MWHLVVLAAGVGGCRRGSLNATSCPCGPILPVHKGPWALLRTYEGVALCRLCSGAGFSCRWSNAPGKTRWVTFGGHAIRLRWRSRSFWPLHPSGCETSGKYSRQPPVPAGIVTCLCMCLAQGVVGLNIPGLIHFTWGKTPVPLPW